MLARFTNLYPVWIVASSVMALIWPETLRWFSGQWVVWALTDVMLGMGFKLTFADFRQLFSTPGTLALGFLAHYSIMPLLGWSIARLLQLESGLLHVFGFVFGYAVTRLLRYPQLIARTIAIEVGMQNGGMAAVLAKKSFPLEPAAAVPAVFSSVVQTIVGSLAAASWRARPTTAEPEAPAVNPVPESNPR